MSARTVAPRTCCATHADRCRFGRPHTWAGPFLLAAGRPVDGRVWSHPDDVACATCGGTCTADRDTPATDTARAWWITIDRQYADAPAQIGPYLTEADAEHALQHAPMVDNLCHEDCLDAYYERHDRMPDGDVHVIDPTDPHHTGKDA